MPLHKTKSKYELNNQGNLHPVSDLQISIGRIGRI